MHWDKVYQPFLKPRFADDELPNTTLASLIALADKLDTLVGFFALNKQPTGEKDPYGCRRLALAIIRLLEQPNLCCPLAPLVDTASGQLPFTAPSDTAKHVLHFLSDRLSHRYPKKRALLLAVRFSWQQPLQQQISQTEELETFISPREGSAFLAAFKRVHALTTKHPSTQPLQKALCQHPAEKGCLHALATLSPQPSLSQHLTELNTLFQPINQLLDEVMILDPDHQLRENRLALLAKIYHQVTQQIDFSHCLAH